MPRSDFDYNQSSIGVCGHVVWTWPLITYIGGGHPEAMCETCTRIKWALDPAETLTVWVRLKPDKKTVPITAKPKRTPKARKLSPMQLLMQEEGLF